MSINLDAVIREAEKSETRLLALNGLRLTETEAFNKFGEELLTQAALIKHLAKAIKEGRG